MIVPGGAAVPRKAEPGSPLTASAAANRRHAGLALVLAVLASLAAPLTAAAAQAENGRIIATITTLEGTVHMPGVQVELRAALDGLTIAKTTTDGAGQVLFPDIPPGKYILAASRPGFESRLSPAFELRAGEAKQVLLDIQLTFAAPAVEVRAEPSPTDSVQPVSMSDMLSGNVLDIAPLPGDDFQSLLPLLPGVVRGPDGRLRIRGGQPTQGALQLNSASLIDPSTGDFDLQVPGQSVESVEVLANPFLAEYGRFSTSITQVRTRRGTDTWEIKPGNLMPRFKGFTAIRGFEPRLSIRGPLQKDRTFLSQDFQYRYATTKVTTLAGDTEYKLQSFDSYTRIDALLSSRHLFGGTLAAFPRTLDNATVSTFRPPESTPEFSQGGAAAALVDRFAITQDIILETTLAGRFFEVDVAADGTEPMVYTPQTQSGSFFNTQEREVGSLQWVQALSFTRAWYGDHIFKVGWDVQRSHFDGYSESRPIEIRRFDGSMAEYIEFDARSEQQVSGVETALFAQDRWRLGQRVTFELGLRLDRDATTERANWSPRAGVAVAVAPEGRAIVRGGFGKFVQRAPLNIDAFTAFESRTISRFPDDMLPIVPPGITYRNTVAGELRTPEANVGNIEWDQRFSRRVLLKVAYLQRWGSHEFILQPVPELGQIQLSSTGKSRYRELESTVRYLGGGRKDLTLSYVWSRGLADLNTYDQFYGNFRNPILRPNEYNLIPTDVRHRILLRGTIGLPGKWDFSPVLELRSGFPYSAVDEYQDFVGERNRAGRLPVVRTLDFSVARPWRFKKYTFRAGIRMYNVFGSSSDRDVQNNVASPDFGRFYNPIERSFGFVLGAAR
jgi:hypothetical protein